MGCSCCSHVSNEKDILRVTVFGLENSGKTSLIQCLKSSKRTLHIFKFVSTHGVVGVNVHLNVHMHVNLLLFDCGGCKHQRHIWPHLVNGSDLVLFTIDTKDSRKLYTAQQALVDLLIDDNLKDKPLLIVFTKCDERDQKDIKHFDRYFDATIVQDRFIQKMFFSSITLNGINELSKWFTYFSYQKRHGKEMKLPAHAHLS